MQRLLHEGMDAGLCGFSIQRLGRELGPGRLRRLADGHRHDGATRTSSPWPRCWPSATRASSRSPRPTGNIKADLAFVEKLAAVAERPVLYNAIAPTRTQPRGRTASRCAGSRSAGTRACRSTASAPPCRAGFAFTLEHWNLYDASPAWRAVTTGTKDEKLAKMADPELREALVDEAEEADTPPRRSSRPASAATPSELVVQGVNRQHDLEQYVGRSVGEIAADEGKHPIEVMLDLSLAGDLNVEFLGPDQRLQRRVHGRDDQRLALHHPRRVRRRRPHQVLHRRRLDAPTS